MNLKSSDSYIYLKVHFFTYCVKWHVVSITEKLYKSTKIMTDRIIAMQKANLNHLMSRINITVETIL